MAKRVDANRKLFIHFDDGFNFQTKLVLGELSLRSIIMIKLRDNFRLRNERIHKAWAKTYKKAFG